jgi:hypothetical protein
MKSVIPLSTLAAISFGFSTLPSQARLGETLEQITQRYGQPIVVMSKKACESSEIGTYYFMHIGRKPDVGSDGTPLVRTMQFNIQCEFKDGKAWSIRYSSLGLSEQDLREIRDLNAGAGQWGEALEIKSQKRTFWRDVKGSGRVATAYRTGRMNVLRITDGACAEQLATQRTQEISLIADMADWAPSGAYNIGQVVQRGGTAVAPTETAPGDAAGQGGFLGL